VPSHEEEEEEQEQEQDQDQQEEEWQAEAQEEAESSSAEEEEEEDTIGDTSSPAVWLQGPSRLPDRPIPVALRPLIRLCSDM